MIDTVIKQMEKLTPVRNWKYVHHHRKQSEDSMDNSIDSVQSSKSGKFNRFQFRKEEKSPLRDPREQIFVFTGKSRDRNHDRSLLSKNSLKDKESDTSKISDNQLFLKALIGHPQKTDNKIQRETPRKEKETETKIQLKQEKIEMPLLQLGGSNNQNVKEIVKQVKGITDQFKKVISLFARKYRDMRYEWDRSFKALLTTQLNIENQVIRDLKLQLEKKQEELDQLAKISFSNPLSTPTPKSPENTRPLIANSSLDRLAISKVEKIEPPNQKETFSRNNIIADFLTIEVMREKEDKPTGPELRNLRQTIKRMQQILEE